MACKAQERGRFSVSRMNSPYYSPAEQSILAYQVRKELGELPGQCHDHQPDSVPLERILEGLRSSYLPYESHQSYSR